MSCADSLAVAFTREKIAKYVAEFIGTAWLVLIIKLSVIYFPYPSLSIGLGLMCIIYTYGYVSFAHYNPSITLAFTIRNIDEWPRSDYAQIVIYYIVEYLGGITGGLLGWAIGGKDAAYVHPYRKEGASLGQAFMAELVFTFILASVILHVATDKRQAKNQFYGIAIGMVVTSSIMCIGPVSGCCLNSAVYLGTIIPAIFASLNPDNPKVDLSDCWIYIIAPFVGAALAALQFNCIFDKGSRTQNDDKCVSFSSFSNELKSIQGTAQNEML
mmetsp:Transcript_64571/g.58026  ORF Transcript_64571/g.58026 Transcript_64571/m.58026 type:complete len:271 (+) Transcript_64571:125-937(+)